jgi:RHS repeat-associated protein
MLVSLSTGTKFDTYQSWAGVPGFGNGYDYGRYRVGDFNADGSSDLLFIGGDGLMQVAKSMGRDSRLEVIRNGLGGTVTAGYAIAADVPGAIAPLSSGPAPAWSTVPNAAPRFLVTGVTTHDGRLGHYTTQFAYSDARVVPGFIPDRRNAGFASMVVRDAQTGQYTTTFYNQVPGKEGTVSQVDDRTAANLLVKQILHTYEVVVPPDATGVEFVRETQELLRAYELGVFAFTQWTTTTYDDYGNARVKEQYADGLPTVSVTTTYANDTANWILGRVTRMTTTSGTTTLGDMSNGWVGNTLRTKSEWLNTNNSWVTTTMDYDLNGNVTSVTEPDAGDGIDRTTTTEFDPTYRAYPAMVVNALGQPTQKTYEADGQVRSVTDMNEQDVTTTYDTFGRKLTEVGPGSQRSEFEYRWYGDPNRQYNRIVTWVDGSRYQWREEYFDGSGFKYGVTSSGDCPSAWVVVDHEKDAAGRPHRTSQPYCFGDTSVSTTTEYDAAGRVSSITTPDGKVTAYSFTTAYAAITDANSKVTKKYFNARNKTTAVADPAGRTTVFGYDPLGRLTSITAPDNSITRVWYDSLNRRTRLEEPQVAASTYTYDAVGNVRSTTTRGRTTTFAYDALNRVYLKQPQGETPVTYTYDEAAYENGEGRLTTVVDASGTTHMAYSPTGKLKGFSRRIDGKDFSQAFAFDRADRMTQVTYPNGSLAEYRYTDGGGLYTVSLDGVTMVSWGDYDATGKPHFVSYGNGVETAYQYDGMGHLSALSTTKGANVLQDLTYDWYGRPNTSGLNLGSITDNRSSKLCSDGSNTDETQVYSYDDLYRITQADGVWGSKPYAYTVLGNPYTFGGLTTRTLNFTGQQVTSGTGLSNVTYDPATGNMTRKVLDGNDSEYGWTAEGLLAWVRTSGALTAMTYDGQGQRVKKVYTPSTSGMVTTTYIGSMYEKRSYSDGSPERHTIHLFGNGQLVASLTMAGNILTASSSNPNAWRAESAYGGLYDVKSVEGAAAKVLHLARAAAAHPKSGRVLGAVLLLPLAAWLLVAFASALLKRGFSARFSPSLRFACMGLVMTFGATACSGGSGGGVGGGAPDRLLITGDTRSGPPPGTHFYHRNHINSSSVITDSAGSEVSRYVYLPFGELAKQNSCGVDTVTAKFTGKELDEETNLYYYGARYYDPAIGRFLSPDTVLPSLTDAQLLNRYSYVRNNPIVYVDPTGHMPDFIGDVLNAVGNAVDYVASAVNRAADWIAGAARKAGDFIARAADSTWQMLKAFGSNPAALGIFIVALGVAIATGNAPAIVIIIKVVGSTLAAMAAQSIAMAAGVTNPTVLSIIGMAAGMAASGAGLSQFLKAGASYGLAYALGKAEAAIWGDKTAAALAPLNALAATLVVNGLAKTFSSRPAIAQQSLGETPNDGYGSGGDSGRMTKWGSMDATERLFYGVKTVIEMGGAMGIVITAIAGTLAFPVALAVGVVGALGMMAVGYQVMIDTTQPVYNPRLTAGRKRKRNRRRERWAPSAMRPCASAT